VHRGSHHERLRAPLLQDLFQDLFRKWGQLRHGSPVERKARRSVRTFHGLRHSLHGSWSRERSRHGRAHLPGHGGSRHGRLLRHSLLHTWHRESHHSRHRGPLLVLRTRTRHWQMQAFWRLGHGHRSFARKRHVRALGHGTFGQRKRPFSRKRHRSFARGRHVRWSLRTFTDRGHHRWLSREMHQGLLLHGTTGWHTHRRHTRGHGHLSLTSRLVRSAKEHHVGWKRHASGLLRLVVVVVPIAGFLRHGVVVVVSITESHSKKLDQLRPRVNALGHGWKHRRGQVSLVRLGIGIMVLKN